MRIGYAREALNREDLEEQRVALRAGGCSRIFEDAPSAARVGEKRPGLDEVFGLVESGDALVVSGLHKLGRGLPDLTRIALRLKEAGVGLVSLDGALNTTDSADDGGTVFGVFEALAGSERARLGERTRAGLSVSRARGRRSGRRPVMDEEKIQTARELLADPRVGVAQVCAALGISRSTLYRAIGPGGTGYERFQKTRHATEDDGVRDLDEAE